MAKSSENGFSSSYMLLKPEEVGFFDLVRILFSAKLGEQKFVEYSPPDDTVAGPTKDEDEEDGGGGDSEGDYGRFRRRWMLFVSILAQKFMLFTSKTMVWIGWAIEMWLNLVASNQNIGRLFLNLLRGKVVKPDETSESYLSFIGNMDKRVKLDSSIKYGDPRYFGALSMMASKASYENKAYIETIVRDHWKMECLGVYDFWNDYQEKATTQAFLLREKTDDHEVIVVAFRGTEPFNAEDWCSDFDISWFGISGVGKVHGGFMKALGLQKNLGWPKDRIIESQQDHQTAEAQNDNAGRSNSDSAYYGIRAILKEILSQNEKAKFILTGHSLGGALAILFPAILVLHGETMLLERLEGVYTFGQPRVGNGKFGEFMEKKLSEHKIRYFRYVYCNDMVPRLPYDDKDLLFKHFGTCIYFNRHYKAKIVEEEPNKNYFSPLGAIPMMINAFGELIRSFTIPGKMGAEFKEGSFMRLFRIIGLVLPGIPAHSTQDYVNATRLGSKEVYLMTHVHVNNSHDIV